MNMKDYIVDFRMLLKVLSLTKVKIILIYRRENPTTPSKRFKSVILNPTGTKIIRKHFYKTTQCTVGKHFGSNVALRRKKSNYKTKFNLWNGVYLHKMSIITQISLCRRYKTFVGLLTYSDGAMSCLSLFSGAYILQLLKVWTYIKTPKLYLFSNFNTGSTVPIAFLRITNCFFNIMKYFNNFSWFCKAGGTFCIIIRLNVEKCTTIIKLPSFKHRILHDTTYVMLGRNSNILIRGIWLGKAGINIKKGFKTSVRGVAMNPVDHPHGGRTKSNSPERTPWGKIAKHSK